LFEECGLNNGAINYRQPRSVNVGGSKSRLVNGKETQKGAWPWQVSIKIQDIRLNTNIAVL